MSDIMLDVNKKRFRDVLREHMIEKNGNKLIKSDDYALIGIYSRAGKYIVCDSTRSDKADFRYSISDRLEFDDIESATMHPLA